MSAQGMDKPAYLERDLAAIEPATGLTFQELAQKNRLDAKLDARVAEIVQANYSEHDPED